MTAAPAQGERTPAPIPVTSSVTRRPPVIRVVFDRFPPYARGRYAITVGKSYRCELVDENTALYETTDDAGASFRLATYGQGYSNGGWWHIEVDDQHEYRDGDALAQQEAP